MTFPRVEIFPQRIQKNGEILRNACLRAGVTPVAVIKGFNAHPAIYQALERAGYTCMCSSRLAHLEEIKQLNPELETMMLRVPMLSQVEQVVATADVSLNSEPLVLEALDREAARQGRTHRVILMRDLGDLREGQLDREAFFRLAELAERLPHLHLLGVGTNLTCYGSVIPTEDNLGELVADAKEVERRIGRRLEVVSGGSTSSLPLVYQGKLPEGINQLRLGEALIVPWDLQNYWQCPFPGLSNRGLLLQAEVIEASTKPTLPIGPRARNAFGTETAYEDRGWRKRLLLAVGVADLGDETKVIPEDPGMQVLGASSDHLLVDVEDSAQSYRLGDTVTFQLRYKSMLFSMSTPEIAKIVCTEPPASAEAE